MIAADVLPIADAAKLRVTRRSCVHCGASLLGNRRKFCSEICGMPDIDAVYVAPGRDQAYLQALRESGQRWR